ncbi:flagellar filament capping protein FliD [Neomoorella humiferrea]|uniref:Flagellar hook-associated protein 2 n=1 Tax=Neomoorella humiferrea TaxID=676965 RepID=A0A2T0AN35_9FIRM|nr:flagellar filament capping protein FliD [Moorella humiferrea]PRR70276.1 Flagellar hook-associated protein 2 [Moorella humiferrea]
MASGIYFSGLASGIDTESIITQLMNLERVPLTKLQQRKNQYNVEKNAWHDIYTRLSNLQSKLASLKLSSTFTGMKATSSNTAVLTATASSSAVAGRYRIGIVQLAQAHKVASQQPLVYGTETQILTDTFNDATYTAGVATLSNLTQDTTNGIIRLSSGTSGSITSNAISINAANGGRLTLTVSQQERLNTNYVYQYRTFDGTTWSDWQTLGSLNGDGFLGYKTHTLTATLNGNVQQIQLRATLNGDSTSIPMLADWTANFQPATPVTSDTQALGLSGSFSITVGGQTRNITVSASDSLQSIAALINTVPASGQTSGAGDIVTAAVIDHRLVLTSKTSGAAGAMSFTDSNGVLNSLGLVDGSGKILSGAVVQDARDAVFTVDGLTISRPTNTITDVITGVTLNLLGVTDADGNKAISDAETINLEVGHDIQKAIDAVKELVDQYNSVMDFISTKGGKDGDLQGDPTLARIGSSLWRLMTDTVSGLTGNYRTPWSIGISTGEVAGSGALTFDRSGKITLDTDKLTAALQADPQAVMAIFTNDGKTGLADRLDTYLTSLVRSGDGLIPSREKSLQDIMDDIDDQISRMEDRLAIKEEQLRRQFTAMEQALAALQSQGNWLAGQIAGLGAYQKK